jgi:hypothetical protein
MKIPIWENEVVAGGGSLDSSAIDLGLGYKNASLIVSVLNGGTGPSVPAAMTVKVGESANDVEQDGGVFTASKVLNIRTPFRYRIDSEIRTIQVLVVGGDDQSVTINGYILVGN